MDSFRTHFGLIKTLVILILLSISFQVQTVFACQMMDQSGPIKHCCCDTHKSTHDNYTQPSDCCDISSELNLNANSFNGEAPFILPSKSTIELPPTTLTVLAISLWPETTFKTPYPELWDLNNDPGSPGTATYFSTLRLRI